MLVALIIGRLYIDYLLQVLDTVQFSGDWALVIKSGNHVSQLMKHVISCKLTETRENPYYLNRPNNEIKNYSMHGM